MLFSNPIFRIARHIPTRHAQSVAAGAPTVFPRLSELGPDLCRITPQQRAGVILRPFIVFAAYWLTPGILDGGGPSQLWPHFNSSRMAPVPTTMFTGPSVCRPLGTKLCSQSRRRCVCAADMLTDGAISSITAISPRARIPKLRDRRYRFGRPH